MNKYNHSFFSVPMLNFDSQLNEITLKNWAKVYQEESSLLMHPITGQPFESATITKEDAPSFAQRMVLALPQTPRVVVLGSNVLVERGSRSLSDLLQGLMMCDVLQILRNIIQALQSLQKVYGGFRVEENMIRATQRGQVLVWHNRRFISLKPDQIIASKTQQVMINDTVKLFRKNTKHSLKTVLRSVPTDSFASFDQGISALIKNWMKKSAIQLPKEREFKFQVEQRPRFLSTSPCKNTTKKVPEFVKNFKSPEKLLSRMSYKPELMTLQPGKNQFRGSVPLLMTPIFKSSGKFQDDLKTRKDSDGPSSTITLSSCSSSKGFEFARKNLKKKPTTEILMEQMNQIFDDEHESLGGVTESMIRRDLDKLFTPPTTPRDFAESPQGLKLAEEFNQLILI